MQDPTSDPYAPPARYDRDLDDLVSVDGDGDAESGRPGGISEEVLDGSGWAENGRGRGGPCRRVLAVVAVVGVVAVGGGLGVSAVGGVGALGGDRSTAAVASVGGSNAWDERQRLLEIAEEVVVACGERRLRDDASGCKGLCHRRMCCIDYGGRSCRDDWDCAAYTGCEALVAGRVPAKEGEGARAGEGDAESQVH